MFFLPFFVAGEKQSGFNEIQDVTPALVFFRELPDRHYEGRTERKKPAGFPTGLILTF
tara:strand:- start:4017 stop:4190 length:174 start_codon:yes stop_codon:yes gene_type:complete